MHKPESLRENETNNIIWDFQTKIVYPILESRAKI